jgi:hypothetical protein
MTTREMIMLILFPPVQAVLFGVVFLTLLMSPLGDDAVPLMPYLVAATLIVSMPVAFAIAPRLCAWREG